MLDIKYLERHITSGRTGKYLKYGIDGLQDKSRKPHNIQPGKVTNEMEQNIINLRITKRFGCNRIRFRLKRLKEISLSTKTIYKVLKKHGLNILKCKIKNRKWKRFEMKKPNQMVQMDMLGPFYLPWEFYSKELFYQLWRWMTVQQERL